MLSSRFSIGRARSIATPAGASPIERLSIRPRRRRRRRRPLSTLAPRIRSSRRRTRAHAVRYALRAPLSSYTMPRVVASFYAKEVKVGRVRIDRASTRRIAIADSRNGPRPSSRERSVRLHGIHYTTDNVRSSAVRGIHEYEGERNGREKIVVIDGESTRATLRVLEYPYPRTGAPNTREIFTSGIISPCAHPP